MDGFEMILFEWHLHDVNGLKMVNNMMLNKHCL